VERTLVVLYDSRKTNRQFWHVYYGGKEEADRETGLMMKGDQTLTERGRIWITTTAKIETWAGPAED
jgi:hypothetical protein